MNVAKVCASCGSERVLLDAWAAWDSAAQDWSLHHVFAHAHCEDCGGETRVVDKPLAQHKARKPALTALDNPRERGGE